VLSLVYMAVFVSVGMPLVIKREELPHTLFVVDHIFTIAFVVEILMRISLEKQDFLTGPDKAWNVFDAVLTCFQVAQSFLRYYSFSILRVAAFIRVTRIFTLFRTMRSVRALRLLVNSMTWQPVCWGAVKLLGFIFVFALLVTQVVQAGIIEHAKHDTGVPEDVLDYFGSLWVTMGSLFMVVTGGAEWQKMIRALDKVTNHSLGQSMFVAYVFIMVFGVTNSINAVYVDRLLNFSEHSRFVAMSEAAIRNRRSLDLLQAMFDAVDRNQNGKLSYKEFSTVIRSPEAVKVLHSLDLEVHAVMALFRLLEDEKDCGSVEIEEFMRSLAGLHEGSAPQLLLSTLVFRGQLQSQKLSTVSTSIEKYFSKMQENMTKLEDDVIKLLTVCRLRRDSEVSYMRSE